MLSCMWPRFGVVRYREGRGRRYEIPGRHLGKTTPQRHVVMFSDGCSFRLLAERRFSLLAQPDTPVFALMPSSVSRLQGSTVFLDFEASAHLLSTVFIGSLCWRAGSKHLPVRSPKADFRNINIKLFQDVLAVGKSDPCMKGFLSLEPVRGKF